MLSFVVYVMWSVPQGSVGPLFFILYMADLADRAVNYGVRVSSVFTPMSIFISPYMPAQQNIQYYNNYIKT